MNLAGTRIWLTGASSGIGEALVAPLVRAGARVAITARRAPELDRVAASAETAAYGGAGARGSQDWAGRGGASSGDAGTRVEHTVLVVPGDVTDREVVRSIVARLEQDWGGIDLAILNAGTYRPVSGADFKAQDVVDTFAVNVFGVMYATEAVLPGMLARGAGRLAVTSSMAGMLPLPNAAAYGASKAALTYAFEALRFDLEPRGVGVTLIHPGFVRTPLTRPNRFWMPAMIDVDAAATWIVRGLEHDADEIDFPRRLAWPVQLIRRLPMPLYRRVFQFGLRRMGT